MSIAAALEGQSEHPLAAAVVRSAGSSRRSVTVTEATSVSGMGMVGKVDGRAVAIGNAKLMARQGVALEHTEDADALRGQGKTVVHVAVEGRHVGVLGVGDKVKGTSREGIAQLRASGLRVVMLTGDNERTARAIATQVGIDDVKADVLPAEEANVVKGLQAEGRTVAMAGTGSMTRPPSLRQTSGSRWGLGRTSRSSLPGSPS